MAGHQTNVDRMRAFISQVQEGGKLDLVDQFIHEDFCDHPLNGVAPPGRQAGQHWLEMLHSAVADIRIEVLHCLESDGVVATNKIIRGRLLSDWMGLKSGDDLKLRIMDFVRFEDGLMVEHWATLGQMQ